MASSESIQQIGRHQTLNHEKIRFLSPSHEGRISPNNHGKAKRKQLRVVVRRVTRIVTTEKVKQNLMEKRFKILEISRMYNKYNGRELVWTLEICDNPATLVRCRNYAHSQINCHRPWDKWSAKTERHCSDLPEMCKNSPGHLHTL